MIDNNTSINKENTNEEHKNLEEDENNKKDEFNYINYTDNLIDSIFDKNDDIESANYFNDLSTQIQQGQISLQNELNQMIKDDELNTKKINEKKELYIEKLDIIKNLHNNFENRVEVLNQLYSDKLAYISLLSKNLFEFEKCKTNIEYANKIFEYINELNKGEDLSKIQIPEIFNDPEKILTEGIEIYLSFQQLIDSCAATHELSNFISNFGQIENKIKQTIKKSINEYYVQNDWEKLQRMLQVTEVINSDMIIDLYVSFIIEDIMKLDEYTESIKKVNFKNENISEELFSLIFKIADEFHESLLQISSDQFGSEFSKIFLLFPEVRQKLIISSMVTGSFKKMNTFRQMFLNEQDKSDETYVRIVQYFYPKTIKFLEEYKKVLEYSKTDLISSIEQETNICLRGIEAIYMNKERSLLNSFLESSYTSKINKIAELKNIYHANSKAKGNNPTGNIIQILNDTFELISSTNFSNLHKQSSISIRRYNLLIKNKEEKEDLTETFCKEVFDSIQTLLLAYCSLNKFIILECEKKSFPINQQHFLLLSKINYCNTQFKQIFLYELRDFFRKVKFYDIIEEYVYKCAEKVDLGIENLFNELNSYTSIEFAATLKTINYKVIYKLSSSFSKTNTEEFDNIGSFIIPILKCINENWSGMDKYKSMICLLFTNMIENKMKEIYKNGKFTETGVVVMKNDFQKISNTFAEYTDEFFYNKIYDMFFLTEIFTTSKNELSEFCANITKDQKYDKDLIKIIKKKRKTLHID